MLRHLLILAAFACCVPAAAQTAVQPGPGPAEIIVAREELARMGYGRGIGAAWDFGDRMALRAYQRDWQLSETGELTPELGDRLGGIHPETAGRWFVTPAGCRVWNRFPQARETMEWTGPCPGGTAAGEGELTVRYMRRGAWREQRYQGRVEDGRLSGQGTLLDEGGTVYRGGWRDSRAHGRGELVDGGRIVSGEWLNGCLWQEDQWWHVGARASECTPPSM